MLTNFFIKEDLLILSDVSERGRARARVLNSNELDSVLVRSLSPACNCARAFPVTSFLDFCLRTLTSGTFPFLLSLKTSLFLGFFLRTKLFPNKAIGFFPTTINPKMSIVNVDYFNILRNNQISTLSCCESPFICVLFWRHKNVLLSWSDKNTCSFWQECPVATLARSIRTFFTMVQLNWE